MDVRAHAALAERSIDNIATHRDTPAEVRKVRLGELAKAVDAAVARIDAETQAAIDAELAA